jgi:ABC-type antimicrobial peptide transport system permease subunit
LGAQPGQIRSQFLYLSLRLLAGGVILGVIGSWLAGQGMQAVLFHVPAFNLAILAGTVFVIALMSLVACLLPSQRAARISPMESLAEQ